jgi:hypothetical protein
VRGLAGGRDAAWLQDDHAGRDGAEILLWARSIHQHLCFHWLEINTAGNRYEWNVVQLDVVAVFTSVCQLRRGVSSTYMGD